MIAEGIPRAPPPWSHAWHNIRKKKSVDQVGFLNFASLCTALCTSAWPRWSWVLSFSLPVILEGIERALVGFEAGVLQDGAVHKRQGLVNSVVNTI